MLWDGITSCSVSYLAYSYKFPSVIYDIWQIWCHLEGTFVGSDDALC